jgi:predicted naringenin-chalcone synthase
MFLPLTSLHLQPPNGDTGQIVVHTLFGDAAAAVVVPPAPACALSTSPYAPTPPAPTT